MWRCKNCNSTEVEILDWIDLNSGEALSDDLDEYYCRQCGTQVDIYLDEEDEDINEKPMGDNTNIETTNEEHT